VQKWTAAVAQSDGFVFVTPEYNLTLRCAQERDRLGLSRGNRKAAGIVTYGGTMVPAAPGSSVK
jgi:hypothetical protein